MRLVHGASRSSSKCSGNMRHRGSATRLGKAASNSVRAATMPAAAKVGTVMAMSLRRQALRISKRAPCTWCSAHALFSACSKAGDTLCWFHNGPSQDRLQLLARDASPRFSSSAAAPSTRRFAIAPIWRTDARLCYLQNSTQLSRSRFFKMGLKPCALPAPQAAAKSTPRSVYSHMKRALPLLG